MEGLYDTISIKSSSTLQPMYAESLSALQMSFQMLTRMTIIWKAEQMKLSMGVSENAEQCKIKFC